MTWNSTAPDGNQSVKSNESILQDNTTYIEDTMSVDHFWDAGGTKDGHHQFVQTEATNIDDSSLQTNATLATDMNGVFYSRFKTSSESTNNQDCQPYFINETGVGPTTNVLQLLGIRSCVVFNMSGTSISSTPYKHNGSVSRSAKGKFTLTFDTSLPSNDYLVFGGGIGNTGDLTSILSCTVENTAGSVSGVKATGFVDVVFNLDTGEQSANENIDPKQGWIVVFGG